MGSVETERFLRGFARIRPVKGAASTVRAMSRAGLPVVLASSADRVVVERAVSKLALADSLEGFTSADDVRKAKPFHDVFGLALARYSLHSRNAVAIGDTPYDIAAAHQIGVACIALRSGGFPDRTLSRADAVFDDLAALWSEGRELFAA
jgi:beta-phosphoglucomutase-like phosphatase (HAD superfamily)